MHMNIYYFIPVGTPLGEKTIAVAEKVATDSADDLEAFVEADKSLPGAMSIKIPLLSVHAFTII